jgi:hypothetical protein
MKYFSKLKARALGSNEEEIINEKKMNSYIELEIY